MTTYYDMLGVGPRAGANEIKAAHRRLAMKFHPDRTLGADTAVRRLFEDKFRDIQEAYDTLRDKAKRAEYDGMLAMLNSGEYYEPPPPPPPSPSPPPRKAQYCPSCRKAMPASAPSPLRFCVFCGASLQSSTPPSNRERPQPPPPPQTHPKQNPRTLGELVLLLYVWMMAFGILCAPIRFLLQGVFNITDDAAMQSAVFLGGSLVVTWIFFVKNKVKLTVPALILPIILFLIGTAIAVVNRKEASQLPGGATPARAVQRQTSEVARTRVQTPIQTVSPQPPNWGASTSRGRPDSAFAHEPGCGVSEEAKKLGFVPDSCKSGKTWVKVVAGGPTGKHADVSIWLPDYRNVQATISLGNSLRDKGDFDGAIAKYREALHLRPADGKLHSDLGWAFEHKGDLGDATTQYNIALRINPLDNFSRAGLSRIDKRAAQQQAMKNEARQGEVDTPTTSRERADGWHIPRFLTMGSPQADIRRILDTPTSVTEAKWDYGPSNVDFSSGRVVGWVNYPSSPLLVGMLHVDGRLGFFTEGSTKDAVLAVQGTPTHMSDTIWGYGGSSVYFSDGRVTGWRIDSSAPLRVKVLLSGPVDGNRGYFTVGSTKDEVLVVQGIPTSLTDTEWGYGLSSVYFIDGRVVSWRIRWSDPLKVRGSEPEALGLKPNNDSARVQFGVALGNQGDWDGEIAEEREALRRNPNNGNAHYFLGMALEREGNYEEALGEYRAAHELAPQNPLYRGGYERLLKQVNH